MQGRRNDVEPHLLEPGDFTKRKLGAYGQEGFDTWWYRSPNGLFGRLSMPEDVAAGTTTGAHHVEEHDDGLITVLPQPGNSNSILVEGWNGKYGDERAMTSWHGYIRHGVWEAC